MASPGSEESYEAAVQTLVDHLKRGCNSTELVDLPSNVWKPFNRTVGSATSNALRPLEKLFAGKFALYPAKLSPQAFSNIISIVSCAPDSPVQQRLLRTFLNCLRQWKDDDATLAALKRCKVNGVNSNRLLQLRDTLAQNLVKSTIRTLRNDKIDLRAKCSAAQILTTVVRDNPKAQNHMSTGTDFTILGLIIQDHDDYVLRFLIADALRELLSAGIDRNTCWPAGFAQHLIESFPTDRHTTSRWLVLVQDYLSDLDTSKAFEKSRQSVFRADKCVHWKDNGTLSDGRPVGNILMVFSDQINCLIPDQVYGLVLAEYPIFSPGIMTVKHIPSSKGDLPALRVEYLEDKGYEVMDGTRAAVRGLEFELMSTEAATTASEALQILQEEAGMASDTKPLSNGADTTTEEPDQKRSVAIIDLESPGRDYSTAESHQGDAADQSETQTMTPLERKAKPRSAGPALNALPDQLSVPDVPEGEVQHPPVSFEDRLRASREPRSKSVLDQRTTAQPGQSKKRSLAGLESIKPAQPSSSKSANQARLSPAASSHAAKSTASGLKRPQKQKAPLNDFLKQGAQDRLRASKAIQEPTSQESDHVAPTTIAVDSILSKVSGKDGTKSKGSYSTTADGESQLQRLKRSKPASRTSNTENIDWDEGLRDGQEYDLPSDKDDENDTPQTRPKKKAKTEPNKTSGKTASSKTSETALGRKVKKPELPVQLKSKPTKKKMSGNAKTTAAAEPTLATTRSRRLRQPQVYDEPEDSESQDSSHGGNHSSSGDALIESQPRLKAINVIGKQSGEAKLETESVSTSRSTFKNNPKQGKEQEGSQLAPVEFSDDSSPAPVQYPNSKFQRQASEEANEVAQSTTAAAVVAEDAQDSHPLAKADVDAFAASAKEDFESQLMEYVDELRPASNSKGDRPPDPKTPFGDKTQFVANVNASKSKTPRTQRQSSRAAKSSVAAVSSLNQRIRNDEAVVVSRSMSPSDPPERQWTMNSKKPLSVKSVSEVGGPSVDHESGPLAAEAANDEQEDEELVRSDQKVPVAHHAPVSEKVRHLNADEAHLAQARIRKPASDTMQDFKADQAPGTSSPQLTAENLKRHQSPRRGQQPSQLPRQSESPVNVSPATISHPGPEPANDKAVGRDIGTLPPDLVGRPHALTRTVAKLSNDGLSTTAGTPGAGSKGLRLSDFPPTSEKAMSRTKLIHFDKTGPKNQGRSTDLSLAPGSKTSAVPRQEPSHEAFKRSSARESLPVEVTPSHESRKDDLEKEANADQTEPTEACVEERRPSDKDDMSKHSIDMNNEDGDFFHEAHNEASVDEAHDDDQAYPAEPDWDECTNSMDLSPPAEAGTEGTTAARHISPEGTAASDSLSDTPAEVIRQKPFSTRGRREEKGAFHEQSDLKTLHAGPNSAVNAKMPVADVLNPHQNIISEGKSAVSSRSAVALQDADRPSRRSIGIGGFTSRTFPAAQPVITTTSFRAQTSNNQPIAVRSMTHTPAENTVNPLGPTPGKVTTAIEQSAVSVAGSKMAARHAQTVGAAPYQKAMPPPPPPKASASRKSATPGVNMTKQSRTSILKQKPGYESHATMNAKEPRSITSPAHVPTNRDASETWSNVRPEVLGSTPEPFHTKLEEDVRQADEARARREASTYLTEDSNDHTIVNDDPEYSGVFLGRPLFKSFCETTVCTNDSSSVADDEDAMGRGQDQAAWRRGLRGSHRGLLDVVMQVTKDVLFRLGEEEDAIIAKQSNFDQGGELVIGELVKSWNDRLEREQGRLVKALRERSESLGKRGLKKGLFDDGRMAGGSVLREADVLLSTQGLQEKLMLTENLLNPLLEEMKEASLDKPKETTV